MLGGRQRPNQSYHSASRPGDHQRHARRGGRPARRRGPARANRRARGVPRRPLRARIHHDVGPGHAQDAQAQGHALRHRRRRALQKARDQRGGGHHRDAPGRRVDAAHRGRQRDPVGRGRFRRHGLQPQRQGVQIGRRVAVPAADPRLPAPIRTSTSTAST